MKNVRIGSIATFINGLAFKPTDWSLDGRKIIRIQNLTDLSKPFNRTKKVVPEKYIVRKGDVLVSWSATIDVFLWEGEECVLNQHIFKVEFDSKKVHKDYFIYALKKTINDLQKYAHGSTMKHVVKSDFENHKIPLPPIDNQIKIAFILNKVENIRKLRKENILLIEEYLKSIFHHLFDTPVTNKKKFDIVLIEDISTEIKDGPHISPDYVDNGIPILSTRNIRPGRLLLNDVKYVSKETYSELIKRFRPQKGDVIITKGGTTGYAKSVDFDFDFCIWVHLAIVRLKPIVNPIYFEHAINSHYGYFQSQKYTSGVANKDLGLKKIAKIKMLLPPLELQNHFTKIVENSEILRSNFERDISVIEKLSASLIDQAFRGDLYLESVDLFLEEYYSVTDNERTDESYLEKATNGEAVEFTAKKPIEKNAETHDEDFIEDINILLDNFLLERKEGFLFCEFTNLLRDKDISFEFEDLRNIIFQKLDQKKVVQYYSSDYLMKNYFKTENSLYQHDFSGTDGNMWLAANTEDR